MSIKYGVLLPTRCCLGYRGMVVHELSQYCYLCLRAVGGLQLGVCGFPVQNLFGLARDRAGDFGPQLEYLGVGSQSSGTI